MKKTRNRNIFFLLYIIVLYIKVCMENNIYIGLGLVLLLLILLSQWLTI